MRPIGLIAVLSHAVAEKDGASREYLVELSRKIAGTVFMADRGKREALVGAGSAKPR